MFLKYKNPLLLFLFLEKTPIVYWTSKTISIQHNIVYVPKKWFYLLTQIMKYELIFNNNFLIENSAVDTSSYKTLPFNTLNMSFNKILNFYTFYYYNIKTKITFFIGNNILSEYSYTSIDKLYPNANWLERETSEMYNLIFFWKNDTRRLLLDYSKNENPMLKNYPCEGYVDVFYNIFENQVTTQTSETIEL